MAHPASQTAPKRVPTSTKVRLQVAGLEAQLQVKLREIEELQAQKADLVERLTQLQEALRQHPLPAGSTCAGPPCSDMRSSGLPVLVERQLAGALHALWQHTAQERHLARQGRFSATAEQAAARNAILAQLRGCWCTILQAISAVLHQQQQQQQQQQQEDGLSPTMSQHQQLLVKLQQALQLILESLAQASPYCLWHFVAMGSGTTDRCSRSSMVAGQAPAVAVREQQVAAAAAAATEAAAAALQLLHMSAALPSMPTSDSGKASWQVQDAAGATRQFGGSSSSSGGGLCTGWDRCRQPQQMMAVPAARNSEFQGRTGRGEGDGIRGLLLPDLEQLLALEGEDMEQHGFFASAPAATSLGYVNGTQQQYCSQEQGPWLTLPVVDFHPAAATAAAASGQAQWDLNQEQVSPPAAAGFMGQQPPLAQPGAPSDLLSQLATALLTGPAGATQEGLPPACTMAAGGTLGPLGVPAVTLGMGACLQQPCAAVSPAGAGVLYNGCNMDLLAGMGIGSMPGAIRLNSSDFNNSSLRPALPQRPTIQKGMLTSTAPGNACSRPVGITRRNAANDIALPLAGAVYSSTTPSGKSSSMLVRTGSLLAHGLGSGSSSTSMARLQELPRPLFGAMLSCEGLLAQSGPWPVQGIDGSTSPAWCRTHLPVPADPLTAHFVCIGPAAAAGAMALDTSAVHMAPARAAAVAAGGAALSMSSPWQLSQGVGACIGTPPIAAAAPPPAPASWGPARSPAAESSRWQVLLDRLQLRPHQVAKLLQLYGALADAQRILHLRLSELSHRLLDLSHASTQALPGVAQANAAPPLGQGLLRMGDPALLEAADELQHLLQEGHQLMVELLLGVWGPQSPMTTDQCCRGLVAALPTLPDTGALMELLAQQQQQQQQQQL